ncbi:hypothetical protein Q876_09050 [Listeria monocytogenes]|nr:hypothetical protein [Listeria monocytogenes]
MMNTQVLEQSAYVADALQKVDIPQKVLAADLNVSRSQVGHMATGRRSMSVDVAEKSMQVIDDSEYITSIAYVFTDGSTAPLLNGPSIDPNRLSFVLNVLKERQESTQILKDNLQILAKPASELTIEEKETVKTIMYEWADSSVMSYNGLVQIAKYYGYTVKQLFRERSKYWFSMKWLRK